MAPDRTQRKVVSGWGGSRVISSSDAQAKPFRTRERVRSVAESWMFDDGSSSPVAADAAIEELRARIGSGKLESWLISTSGRLLAIVTNTERAMVMLLDGEGDPGEHAADPDADGLSDGFVLANGQDDEYPDEDTVPLTEALRIVHHIIAAGVPPADAAWRIDR